MIQTIQFHNVSKQYRLGMTRTSLPTQLYEFSRNMLRRGQQSECAKPKFHWAVRNISFDLGMGESLALIGPNGAGKTSILKLLAMITKPTSGDIKVNGRLSALIELGAGFHPDLSGRENIFLNGVILGLKTSEIKGLFDEIVDFAELDQFIDTPLKRYSSGMAVRLGFAVASSIRPDILLVDEVLAVGDAAFRMKSAQRIQRLLQGGTSLIFVSHNTGLIKATCKKSLYLEKGEAVYYGDTDDAIDRYNQTINARRKQQMISNGARQDCLPNHVEITSVELVGSDVASPTELKAAYPATVVLDYVAHEDVGQADIVVRIIRADGVSCAVMYSDQDGSHFTIRRGNGRISVLLEPLQLFPGVYYVAVTIKSLDKAITHSLMRSDWFEVRGAFRDYEDQDAVYEPHRIWHHCSLPDGNAA